MLLKTTGSQLNLPHETKHQNRSLKMLLNTLKITSLVRTEFVWQCLKAVCVCRRWAVIESHECSENVAVGWAWSQVAATCNVSLPKAYYDELPTHLRMSKSAVMGRGQQLQELVGNNSDWRCPGERLFTTNLVPQFPVTSEDEFPRLNSANQEYTISHEKPAN